MPENNQMMSVEGQLVGMPLAGPESFSQQQLEYLKRALGVDETVLFENASGATSFTTSDAIENFERIIFYVSTNGGQACAVTVPMIGQNLTGNLLLSWVDTYNSGWHFIVWSAILTRSNNTFTLSTNYYGGVNNSNNWDKGGSNDRLKIWKVIGIHRISGGNQ